MNGCPSAKLGLDRHVNDQILEKWIFPWILQSLAIECLVPGGVLVHLQGLCVSFPKLDVAFVNALYLTCPGISFRPR
jgi:hypothetical protein